MTLIKKTSSRNLLSFNALIGNLFNEEKFFEGEFERKEWITEVNVKDNKKTLEIELIAQGLGWDDFQIFVENDILIVSGEKWEEKSKAENNLNRRELSYTSFSRSFRLPENFREEDIKVKFENGLLLLNIVKKENDQKRSQKRFEIN